jgi:DNA modification methylase
MDAQLLIRIVETYTEPGETILDPMAGSGTTMLACTLGRNVILVELEEKFVKMCRDNWEQVKMRPQLGYTMGECVIMQGDARQLENILCDKIISSPPYIAQTSASKQTEELFKGRQLFKDGRDPQPHSKGQIGDLPYGQLEGLLVDKCIFSPPFAEADITSKQAKRQIEKGYFSNINGKKNIAHQKHPLAQIARCQEVSETNIGNLPYGAIDKIVTSPPFAGTRAAMADDYTGFSFGDAPDGKPKTYGDSEGQIANLPYGTIDKIVTSPPYAEAQSGGGIAQKGYRGNKGSPTDLLGKRSYMPQNIGNSEGQIGNLPYGEIDKIITSPPYEAVVNGTGEGPLVTSKRNPNYRPMPSGYSVDSIITSPPYEGSLEISLKQGQTRGARGREQARRIKTNSKTYWEGGIGENADNIGNLKSDTYLQAMLQVYQQCYKVLKPQGLMILVTKNFIRNKQIVRLDLDTIKLCEQAGFSFVRRRHRKLPSQSFWRTIYHQKYPDVPVIDKEDVLVFRKGESDE